MEVIDSIAPEISCNDDFEITLLEGQSFYTVQGSEFDLKESTDKCGIESIVNDYNNSASLSGAELAIAETTITWASTDFAGNEAKCSQMIKINPYELILGLIEQKEIRLFPNPTNNVLSITFSENTYEKIAISNIQSKILMEKEVIHGTSTMFLDLSSFKNGLYFLNIYGNSKNISRKVLIRH
jgi:hypothetical protein